MVAGVRGLSYFYCFCSLPFYEYTTFYLSIQTDDKLLDCFHLGMIMNNTVHDTSSICFQLTILPFYSIVITMSSPMSVTNY